MDGLKIGLKMELTIGLTIASTTVLTRKLKIAQPQQESARKLRRTKRRGQRPEPSGREPTDDVQTLSTIIFFFP
jgi:hypothetical protein